MGGVFFMTHGWFKLSNDIFENQIICRDAEYFIVWCFLCKSAAFQPYDVVFGGKSCTLQIGQLLTSRKSIATATGVSDSKVERILEKFEAAKLIEQQTSSRNRKITVHNGAAQSPESPPPKTASFKVRQRTASPPVQTQAQVQQTQPQAPQQAQPPQPQRQTAAAYSRPVGSGPRQKQRQASVYSSEASYDLEMHRQQALQRLVNYQRQSTDEDLERLKRENNILKPTGNSAGGKDRFPGR